MDWFALIAVAWLFFGYRALEKRFERRARLLEERIEWLERRVYGNAPQ